MGWDGVEEEEEEEEEEEAKQTYEWDMEGVVQTAVV
jgi:hypothetical protein